MNRLPLQRVLADALREMRRDAGQSPANSENLVNVAGGYACALYIDLKMAGHKIRFSEQTLARRGGVPSDPEFFRDLVALDELFVQLPGSLT